MAKKVKGVSEKAREKLDTLSEMGISDSSRNRMYLQMYIDSKSRGSEGIRLEIPDGLLVLFDRLWMHATRNDPKSFKALVDLLDRALGKATQGIDVTSGGQSLGRLVIDKRKD